MLRIYFHYDRRLLGELCRVAAGVIVETSWEHSGFNIDVSVRIGADDTTGREDLARYLIRAPFSGKKITYNANEVTVIFKTKRATETNAHFETFDPLEFLPAVTSNIPNSREHLVRHYAYYSSLQQSRRRRQGLGKQPLGPIPIALSDDIAAARTARGNWARFIKKVSEIDPLLCGLRGRTEGCLVHRESARDPRNLHALGALGCSHNATAAGFFRRARRFEYVPCGD